MQCKCLLGNRKKTLREDRSFKLCPQDKVFKEKNILNINSFKTNTVNSRLADTPLLRTKFRSPGIEVWLEMTPYYGLSLIWTLNEVPSVSAITRFDCITKLTSAVYPEYHWLISISFIVYGCHKSKFHQSGVSRRTRNADGLCSSRPYRGHVTVRTKNVLPKNCAQALYWEKETEQREEQGNNFLSGIFHNALRNWIRKKNLPFHHPSPPPPPPPSD